MENITLTCPKHNKEFAISEMKSSSCPHCGEWIDVSAVALVKQPPAKQNTVKQNESPD